MALDSDSIEALAARMSAAQQLALKQAVVRQAIHYTTRALPPASSDEGHRRGILAASRWLDCPTQEMANDAGLFAMGERWDGGVRYYDYPEYFLAPAWTAAASGAGAAARLALEAVPDAEREAARKWQVAVARAVLRAEDLPPLD